MSRSAGVFARWVGEVTGESGVQSVLALQDGLLLSRFIANLTGKSVAGLSDENVSNIKAAFAHLEGCGMPLAAMACSEDEVVEGNLEMILTLLWDLADKFLIAPQFPSTTGHWKSAFLQWCQARCGPRGVSVTDFHKSFQDGMALCALVDSAMANAAIVNMPSLRPADQRQNIQLAINCAQQYLKVPALLAVEEIASGPVPDERSILLYVATLRQAIEQTSPSTSVPATPAAGKPSTYFSPPGLGAIDDSSAARMSMRRAMLGRVDLPEGPENTETVYDQDDVNKVTLLLQEMRDPIQQVAELLSKNDDPNCSEAKATFKQLTERMRRLVEVLPETLECTQQASALHDSIQAELRRVRARAEFEEAYIARVIERQQQTRVMSAALQGEITSKFDTLRQPVAALLQAMEQRERHLVQAVVQIEQDKAAILMQAQGQSERDLQRMREAEARADHILRSKISSVSWLETGHRAEHLLKSCEAARVESKQDFPETFVDFNCTLNLRLQHNIVDACGHVLSSMDFEERKLLDDPALAAARGLAADSNFGGDDNKDAIDRILQKAGGSSAAPNSASGWTLTSDGSWSRMQPGVSGGGADAMQTSGLDKILRHARSLSTRDADEYLSQEVVQAVLRGGSRAKHSHGLLEAAYNETVVGTDGRKSVNSSDMRDLGLDILKRVAMGQSQPSVDPSQQRPASQDEMRPPSGEEALNTFPKDMAMKRALLAQPRAGAGTEPWWGDQGDEADLEGMELVALGGWDGSRNLGSFESIRPKQNSWQVKGNMSCSRRGAAAAAINGQIWVVGGWDGQAYLKAVEVYDMATGRWSQVKSMLEPRCYAAAAVMDGKIYVAGGYYGQVNLDSVEVYDCVTDEWKALPRMACPRRGLGLAALNGHLYAVGGWDGKHNLASVESFSSMTGTWRRVPELATARSSVAVAVNGGSLFAIGGWDGKNFLRSVECYAPIYGTVRNPVGEWRTLAPMNVPRSYASAVSVGSRVLVLGGWDGTDGRRLDSVEVIHGEGESVCIYVFACMEKSLQFYTRLPCASAQHTISSRISPASHCPSMIALYTTCCNSLAHLHEYTVQSYDARQDKWTHSPSLTCPRYGLAAVVVSAPPS